MMGNEEDSMSNDPEIYTRTMAKVYAQQGHFDRAVAIYRHLLAEAPYDESLVKALADAETQLLAQQETQKEDLVRLTRQWLRLLESRKRLERLKKVVK
jgi:DNA-binding SARP family transcriptional activator